MPTSKPTVDLTRIWADQAAAPDVLDPGNAKFDTGWTTEIPPHSTFNFLQQVFTQYIAYQNENGISAWDVLVEYPIGGMVKGTDGNLYVSQSVQTGNDPIGGNGTNWRAFSGVDGLFYYPEQNEAIEINTNGTAIIRGGAGANHDDGRLTLKEDEFVVRTEDRNRLNINPTSIELDPPNGVGGITITNGAIDLQPGTVTLNGINMSDSTMLIATDGTMNLYSRKGSGSGIESRVTLLNNTLQLRGESSVTIRTKDPEIVQASFNQSDVSLAYEGNIKLETVTDGVDITGDLNTTGSTCGPSDKRLKEKVKSLDKWESLDIISKLRPVEFEWNEGARRMLGSPEGVQRGLIAQEVEKIIPDIVKEVPSKLLGIHKVLAHGSDTALMMSAIQALNSKMEVLSDENMQLNERVRKLEGRD